MKEMQYKSFSGTTKDVDTKTNTVTGLFASFDNIDSDGDVFIQGAFKRTINNNGPEGSERIKHLLQHNVSTPIGKLKILKETKEGLYFESKMVDTTAGSDALKLYAAGIFNEHSVGFQTIQKEDVERDGDNFTELREVKLWEGSTVTWGANSQTPFSGFKTISAKTSYLLEKFDIFAKLLKDGDLTDETCELLLIQNEQIKSEILSLIPEEPSDSTVQQTDSKDFDQFFKR